MIQTSTKKKGEIQYHFGKMRTKWHRLIRLIPFSSLLDQPGSQGSISGSLGSVFAIKARAFLRIASIEVAH